MAITIEQVASAMIDTDPSVSLTVASGDIIVAAIGIHQGTVNAVNWNGSAITQGPTAATAFNERAQIWYSLSPAAGTYNLTFDGATSGGRFLCGYVLRGVKTTGQPHQTATTTGDSSESSISITPTTNNCLIIDSHYSEGDFTTVGTGQTERANLQSASYQNGASSTTLQGTAAAETMSWTIGSSQRWAVVAIAFEEASGGGTVVIKTLDGLAQASIKTYQGLASASTKTFNNLSNV